MSGLSRSEAHAARAIAEILEHSCGIVTPNEQLAALLQKVRTLIGPELSIDSHLQQVRADPMHLQRFIECFCTHETRFFRHAEQFEYLERSWLPARKVEAPHKVRAWSVACSTGEEAFSLGMLLSDHFPRALGWSVEVVGTDISQRALERAAAATWPLARRGEIEPARVERYMLRGHGKSVGFMRACPELRALVHFQQLNLLRPPYLLAGKFELVFLRNVLIYFSADTRQQVLQAVIELMAPHALLVTGPSEGVSYLHEVRLRSVAPHVYEYKP